MRIVFTSRFLSHVHVMILLLIDTLAVNIFLSCTEHDREQSREHHHHHHAFILVLLFFVFDAKILLGFSILCDWFGLACDGGFAFFGESSFGR